MQETPREPPPLRDRRDRRGRGRRGPAVEPFFDDAGRPRPAVPGQRTRREHFDRVVLDVVEDVDARWHDRLGLLEYAVEEVPPVGAGTKEWSVPLATLVRPSGRRPGRLVLYRRPIEHRCAEPGDLAALVLTVVAEQVSELLGIPAEDVDPRYEGGET